MKRLILAGLVLGLSGVTAQEAESEENIELDKQPTGRLVTMRDFGSPDVAFLSLPVTPPIGGILLIPDMFGLDTGTRTQCRIFSGAGFVSLAADLFNGSVAQDREDAIKLQKSVMTKSALKTIEAGVNLFHNSPRFRTGHVMVVGMAQNADLALEAAIRSPKLIDSVVLIDPEPFDVKRLMKIRQRTLLLIPQNSPGWAGKASELDRIIKERPEIKWRRFKANYGFMRDGNSIQEQADAWTSVVAFSQRKNMPVVPPLIEE